MDFEDFKMKKSKELNTYKIHSIITIWQIVPVIISPSDLSRKFETENSQKFDEDVRPNQTNHTNPIVNQPIFFISKQNKTTPTMKPRRITNNNETREATFTTSIQNYNLIILFWIAWSLSITWLRSSS